MAKTKSKSKGYISSGRVGKNKFILRMMRAERPAVEKYMNKQKAFLKGKKVWFTIENPDKNATNRKYIRVSGADYLGDWRSPK